MNFLEKRKFLIEKGWVPRDSEEGFYFIHPITKERLGCESAYRKQWDIDQGNTAVVKCVDCDRMIFKTKLTTYARCHSCVMKLKGKKQGWLIGTKELGSTTTEIPSPIDEAIKKLAEEQKLPFKTIVAKLLASQLGLELEYLKNA